MWSQSSPIQSRQLHSNQLQDMVMLSLQGQVTVVAVKGIYTRLLSGQTGNQSISFGLNCLQVKTGDQRSPVVRSS